MLPQNKTTRLIILLSLSTILAYANVLFASDNRITSISVDAERPQSQITINLKIKEQVKGYNHELYRLRKIPTEQFVFYMDVQNCYTMLKGGATFKREFTNSPLSGIRIGQNKLNPPITRIACDLTKPIKPDIKLKDGYIQILFSFNSGTPSKTPLNQITGVNVISENPHLNISIELDAKSRVDYGRGMYPIDTTGVKSVFYLDIRNTRPVIDGEEYFVQKFSNPIVSQMEITKQQLITPITRVAFHLNEPVKPDIKIQNNRQFQITFPNPLSEEKWEGGRNPLNNEESQSEQIQGVDTDVQEPVDAVQGEQPETSNNGKPNPFKLFLNSMFRKVSPNITYRLRDSALRDSAQPSNLPGDTAESEDELMTNPKLLKPLEQELNPRLTEATLTEENITSQPVIGTVDLKDTDIRDALRLLAKQGGINIVVDESVQGRISISLNKTTPPEQAIAHVLFANGFAYEKFDEYLLAYAPGASNVPAITKVIPLNYSQASDIKEVLVSLASSPEAVQMDSRTNSIIIADTPTKVRQIEDMVKRLDVEVENSTSQPLSQIFYLQFADASELQNIINEFLSENGKVAVDERTNSLIVLDSAFNIETIAQMVQQLDVETTRPKTLPQGANEPVTRVFVLNYIDANALKESIGEMLSPEGKLQTFVRQKELLKPARQKESDDTRYEEGGVAVSTEEKSGNAQKWSNTLIVTDVLSVIQVVEELIEKLDVMAKQVVIEAKIVEVTLDGTHELGINWQAVHKPSNSLFSSHLVSDENIEPTIQIGTLSAKAFENITGILRALEEKGQARLLANPRTTTLNNELAQIIVADRFPIPIISQNELGTTTGYAYIDVGILLTVIPHVNEDGYILMEASPQIDSLKGEVSPGAPPIISSRLAHCRVMIKDGQTLVIGGLMKDETTEIIRKIPLLGNIPIFGRLFKSKALKTTKTDLIVFITPRIYREGTK